MKTEVTTAFPLENDTDAVLREVKMSKLTATEYEEL